MKVIHSPSILFMRGRESGAVYYEAPGHNFSIKRNYVYPTLTANNHAKGAIMKNLRSSIWNVADESWKNDFKLYAQRFYSENLNQPDYKIPVNNSFGNMVKAAFAFQASDDEHIDLATITVADVVALDQGFRTVKSMIDDGFLPLISSFADLTNDIQT